MCGGAGWALCVFGSARLNAGWRFEKGEHVWAELDEALASQGGQGGLFVGDIPPVPGGEHRYLAQVPGHPPGGFFGQAGQLLDVLDVEVTEPQGRLDQEVFDRGEFLFHGPDHRHVDPGEDGQQRLGDDDERLARYVERDMEPPGRRSRSWAHQKSLRGRKWAGEASN